MQASRQAQGHGVRGDRGTSPGQEQSARQRFDLVLSDLQSIRDDAPILVDGPQLLPPLLAAAGAARESVLFVSMPAALQAELVRQRGSALYAQTRDRQRALANRLDRDEILAARIRDTAQAAGFPVVEISDPRELPPLLERQFSRPLSGWVSRGERGDVGTRRRDENTARLRQWRAHTTSAGAAAQELDLACECHRYGCEQTVRITLDAAETAHASGKPLLAAGHE